MPSSDQILTQNDHSRSFKVTRFGVNEEPLRGYMVQYNNCGLECEVSEDGPNLHRFGDTAVYWSKNRQNRQFVPTPVSEIALARGDPYRIS